MPSKYELLGPLLLGTVAALAAAPSCSSRAPAGGGPADSGFDVQLQPGTFCDLPGSVIWNGTTYTIVPGGPSGTQDLSWLALPAGFCAHYYATVPAARQVRLAPGGDVFVASPSRGTPGGGGGGMGAVVVLPDDNHDGFADSTIPFMESLPATQGLLFAKGAFYFQDDGTIRQVPFAPKERQPSAAPQAVTTVPVQPESDHWSKVVDIAQDGAFYVSNGSGQSEQCLSTRPVKGAIFRVEADGSETLMAKGFRNPIAMRCETNHDVCLVVELERDGSGGGGGREKIVPLHQGDDWGYPCCATKNTPYAGTTYSDTGQTPDCSGVAADTVSFDIGHTPFGLDYEPGQWPAPWTGRVFVTLHGVVGSWTGARVVSIALDPTTGLPLPASELGGTDPNNLLEFAHGWDDGTRSHGRPAAVAFAPDGRLYLTDDWNGVVVWIAPVGLKTP
jgi:glucose/arabinose dehydrogenase